MWIARGRQRHGSQKCNSPWTQKSNDVSEPFGREPRYAYSVQDHRDCYRHLQWWLSKKDYADSQHSIGSSHSHTTRINSSSQATRKSPIRWKSEKGHEKNVTSHVKDGMKRQDCYCCGAKPAYRKSKCPAKDVICHNCGKKGTTRSVAKAREQNQARTESSNKLRYITCRHSQWTEKASLQSTRIQATTCYLNRPNSTQVSQHWFRRIMLRALMTLQASILSHFGWVQQVKGSFTKLSVRST